eukprot:GEMP01103035.1.p1 GENE.GEMP01103035.1~~GEMP01103035.1.p1  ORF type:complete len:182 (+),score=24.15 GEMP01103035.1:47-592(+)
MLVKSTTMAPDEAGTRESDVDVDAYYSEPEAVFTTTSVVEPEDDDDEFYTMRFEDSPLKPSKPSPRKSRDFFFWLRSEIVGKPQDQALKTAPAVSHLDEMFEVPKYLEQALAVGLMLCSDALFHELTFMPVNVLFGLLRRIFWPFNRKLTITEASELTRLSLLGITGDSSQYIEKPGRHTR